MDAMEHEDAVVETHEEWALRKRRESMKVTRFQAKAALLQAGLLDDIQVAIDASEDPLVALAWSEAGFERLSPFVMQMQAAIGMTDDQLDDLFDAAGGVT